MYTTWQRLKAVKAGLKQLHVQHYANLEHEISLAHDSLQQVQSLLAQDFSNIELQQQEARLRSVII